ncbi:ABC transporter ATP-binding protein [Niallia sp. 01092]|uniref:ABC transporter ATP-binding protein n=1 Tax=unclassified Niallia TaxID=2837522 RepID=UPI003FD3B8E7
MKVLNVNINKAGYEGNKDIIHNINFELQKGELVGLIGSNGAGKSTTIKGMLGLLAHMDGKIDIMDHTYSYIPERPVFYDELTLWEHLDFIAAVEKLEDAAYRTDAERLLKKFSLQDHIHQFPQTFSKGMQQKAMLVLAFITKPDFYIIDEPFMGLDPMAMKLLLEYIQEEKNRGAGIIMSTHVLDTAEKICNRFLMIHNGAIVANGTLSDFRETCGLEDASLFDCFHHIAGEPVHE